MNESAFGVDHGEISKKLGPSLPKAITPGKHAAKGVNITGGYGEVPMLPRGARGKAPRHRKPGEAVTKAFTGFLKPPTATRADKLAGMAAHEKKVTGNKPLGFKPQGTQSVGLGGKKPAKKGFVDQLRTARPGSRDYR